MPAAPVFCGSDRCHILVLRAVRLMNCAQVVYPHAIAFGGECTGRTCGILINSHIFYEFSVNSIIFKERFSFIIYNKRELEQAVFSNIRGLPPGRSHYVW